MSKPKIGDLRIVTNGFFFKVQICKLRKRIVETYWADYYRKETPHEGVILHDTLEAAKEYILERKEFNKVYNNNWEVVSE